MYDELRGFGLGGRGALLALSVILLVSSLAVSGNPKNAYAETYVMQWGTKSGTGDGEFSNPAGIATDSSGNVYVADSGNNRVQKFSSTGTFITKWGTFGYGDGEFYNPAGIATDSSGNVYVADKYNDRIQKFSSTGTFIMMFGYGELYSPTGLATDSSGNVYVADSGSNQVQKFSSTGTFITKWGTYGTGNGQFDYPYGVATDSSGNVYVSDANNNRVQKFSSTGTFITKWGTYGSGNGQFYYPSGIATDSSGNVYVIDTYYDRIQKFSSTGTFITKWGSFDSGDGQFYNPNGIAINSGNVYVADTLHNRIQEFSSNGVFIRKWGPTAADGQFLNAYGVATDSSGNVYVADSGNQRIQKFSSNGAFITKWGDSGFGNGQFQIAVSIATDSSGNVYVADPYSDRIQKFSSTGTFITKWGTSGTGNGQFNYPYGVATDSSGNVYVSDTNNNRVQKFSSTGTFITKWGTYGTGNGQFEFPYDLATDSSGNVYVSDTNNYRVQKFSSTGTFITKWGTFGSGDGQFYNPNGIAINSGNVYVADSGNQRIQKFSSTGTFITKWGTYGTGNGQFDYPHDLATDSSGNVYVSDTNNYRVQKFNSASNIGAPTLLQPADNSLGSNWRPVFDWSDVINVIVPSSYELLVDNNADFSSPEISATELTSSTFTPSTNLPSDGQYNWKVRVRDGAGNVGPYSGVFTFSLVDNTAPTGTVTINSGNAYTNNPSATLTLTCNDGSGSGCSQVSIAPDGVTFGSFVAITTPTAVTLTAGDGLKTVAVKYKDASGNISPAITDQITLDNTAPTGTVTINSGNAYTNSRSATLTLTCNDGSGSGCSQVSIAPDGVTFGSFVAITPTRVVTLTAGDGLKTVAVKYKDASGIISAETTDQITLETVVPTGTVTINSGNAYTNNPSATLTLTCNDGSGSGCSQVSIAPDGVTFGSFVAITPTRVVTLTAGDGLKTVAVKYKDASGNISPAITDQITLETVVPTGTVTINSGNAYTNNPSATLTLTCNDGSGSGCSQVSIAPDGVTFGSFVAITTPTAVTLTAGDGLKTVAVKYKDASGNISPQKSDTIILDTISPSINSVTVTPNIVGTTAQITITKTVTDAQGVMSVDATIEGPLPSSSIIGTIHLSLTSGTAESGTWSGSFDFLSSSPDGTYTVGDTAQDLAGNPTTFSDGTVTLDRTPPSISMTTITPTIVGAAAQITITTVVSDWTTGVARVTSDVTGPAQFYDIPLALGSGNSNTGIWQTTFTFPPSQSAAPDGSYTTSVRATDEAQNIANVGGDTITLDRTAPVLTAPSNILAEATMPSGTPVTFSASATDNIDSSVDTSCDYTSGATFSLGETTVSCTAQDDAGNTDAKSFTISVQDTMAPTLTLPADTAVEATGAFGALVSFTATASDIVDTSIDAVCTTASGSTFPLGTTPVSCTATDDSGNSATASFNVIVQDTTAPQLFAPGDVTVEATGSDAIAFFAPTAGDTVDSSVNTLCTPSSGSTFPLGTTPVSCTATDDSGNSAIASFNVIVQDTTAPALTVPSADVIAEATSPSGASATFMIFATDIVDGTVTPSCDHNSGDTFAIGTTTVACTAIDAHGNTSPEQSFNVVVRDTTAPVIGTATVTPALAGGNAVQITIVKPVTDDVGVTEVIATVEGPFSSVGVGQASLSLVSGNAQSGTWQGTFTFPDVTQAPDGTYVIHDTATDAAGNKGSTSDGTVTLDRSAPTIAMTTVTPSMVGTTAQITITKIVLDSSGVASASATVRGPAPSIDSVGTPSTLSLVSGNAQSGTWQGTFTFPDVTQAPDGVYYVQDIATDTAGNSVVVTDGSTTLDRTPPVVTVPSDMFIEATGAAGTIVSFITSANDAIAGTLSPDCTPASGTAFLFGATTVTCSATDTAGNMGSSSFSITVQDTTAPALSLSDITEEAIGPSGAVAAFSVSATDLVSGVLAAACTPASGSTFSLGSTIVNCNATDSHGNTGTGSFNVIVQDTTAPLLNVPSADLIAEATSPSGASATFIVLATDIVDGIVAPSCNHNSGDTFAIGTTTVTCTATDAHSNTSPEQSFAVVVRDTTAPALSLPADRISEATGPSGAIVSYPASASDSVDGSITPACNPESGSIFAISTTVVGCTVTDAHGNSASGSFIITVRDTTSPEVTVPADISIEASSATGALVTFDATAADIVDGSIVPTCTPTSGSTFAIGGTIVLCSATDIHGNTASRSFNVLVQNAADTTPPVVTVPSDMTVEATSPSGAVITYSGQSAHDDVDGALTATCTPISGSTFTIATTTINCNATDSHGNIGSNAFTVTVRDTTKPTISGLTDITLLASSAAGASVSYAPTASDAIDGSVPVTCNPASPHVFAIATTTVNCSATDSHGNSATGTFKVKVYVTFGSGFYQPVDNGNVYNAVKKGATVPVKFNVYGQAEIKDAAIINSIKYKAANCDTSLPSDDIETTVTGGTSLRYDATDGHFVYNWKTPSTAGCYQLTVYINDGTSGGAPTTLVALFRLK